MIGNEDVCTLAVDKITVLDLDFHAKEETHRPCPPLGGIVSPIVAVEDATHDGDKACDNGKHQHNGCCYTVMINAVEDIHTNVTCFEITKLINSFQFLTISSEFFSR